MGGVTKAVEDVANGVGTGVNQVFQSIGIGRPSSGGSATPETVLPIGGQSTPVSDLETMPTLPFNPEPGMPAMASPYMPVATPGQVLVPSTGSAGSPLMFLSNPFNTNTTSNPNAFQPMKSTAAPSPIAATTPQQYNNTGVFGQVFNPTPTALPLFSSTGTQIGENSGLSTPTPAPNNNQDFNTSYNNLLSGFYPRKLM